MLHEATWEGEEHGAEADTRIGWCLVWILECSVLPEGEHQIEWGINRKVDVVTLSEKYPHTTKAISCGAQERTELFE